MQSRCKFQRNTNHCKTLGPGPGPAQAQALFNTSQHHEGEEMASGWDTKMTNAADTSTEMTGIAAHLVRDKEAGSSWEEQKKHT